MCQLDWSLWSWLCTPLENSRVKRQCKTFQFRLAAWAFSQWGKLFPHHTQQTAHFSRFHGLWSRSKRACFHHLHDCAKVLSIALGITPAYLHTLHQGCLWFGVSVLPVAWHACGSWQHLSQLTQHHRILQSQESPCALRTPCCWHRPKSISWEQSLPRP